mmetsp:Transcript_27036/g.46125  ORF Transcript_27036/g.46125 Transcript_27036/m.46125 type:complete len:278 (+) Transcript_27036:351-1184(+)
MDLTVPPPPLLPTSTDRGSASLDRSTYNIVELGGGNGTLGVGLAMALNGDGTNQDGSKTKTFQPTAKILCTDNDHRTVKNMRYNVLQQPKECKIGRAVRAESLEWGDEIGGGEFDQRIVDQFGKSLGKNSANEECKDVDAVDSQHQNEENKEQATGKDSHGSADSTNDGDPMQLITHVIGSDVHFGCTTLDPLSSVIAAFKLRNPQINVVMLMKERNPDNFAQVYDLKLEIESKVLKGLEKEDDNDSSSIGEELLDFSVSVRDVLHEKIDKLKLLEC